MSSTRLPAKAMLPIGGIPAALLCARRAARGDVPVVVATSIDRSDDALAAALTAAGIVAARGPLHDVLARFDAVARELPDDAIVVRLTADNVVPDGDFIAEAIAVFRTSGAAYGTTMRDDPAADLLPYGVVCEVFTAAALRDAARIAFDPHDREHVTPWLRRNRSAVHLPVAMAPPLGHLRCTLDTLDDYLRLLRLFEGVDPIDVTWRELCGRLAVQDAHPYLPGTSRHGAWISRLSLGTVQLGLEYGVANRTGQPDRAEAEAILDAAVRAGITLLDTAAAYGTSEATVGAYLRSRQVSGLVAVTKLSPLADLPDDAPPAAVRAHVEASVLRSSFHLGAPLRWLLLHRWRHRTSHGGAIWRALLDLMHEGVIARVGASVASPDEALEALADPLVTFLQIPFNLLDWRWRAAGFAAARAERPDVVVQARSVYLQGLLVDPDAALRVPQLQCQSVLARVDRLVADLGRLDRADLACAYVRAQPWVDTLVIGAETASQIAASAALFGTMPLSDAECRLVEANFADTPPMLLDPSRWSS
jgi:spore coat polysaccharide biosynthesis protein SpsF